MDIESRQSKHTLPFSVLVAVFAAKFEATKNSSFTTFDGSLLIHLSKYDFLNMLSTKKGIPLHFYSR